MNKMEFQEKWKKIALYIAVVIIAVFAVSKAVTVHAGDFTTASAVSTNGSWSGKHVLQKDTVDYYKFTIKTAGEVDIKMMAYASAMSFQLYDSNFNKIDSYCISYTGNETSPAMMSNDYVLSQGTYYISVSVSYGSGGEEYRLLASFASYGIAAAENDSFDSPQNMRVNSKVTGALTYSNEADWYKVSIPVAGKYRQVFSRSGSVGCVLYDKNLSQISDMRYANSLDVELNPGTYYVKVGDSYGGEGRKYTYQINDLVPKKGDILNVQTSQAQYKVTKAGRSGGTVTYQKSTDSLKTSITIPATVKIDGITYKVTGIAANAFKGNGWLKKVTIGKNVSSIGKQAFYQCSNLKTITIKTTKLKASKIGAKSFKSVHKKATIKVPKSKYSAYKKILKKKGAGSKVKYKKI